MTAAGINNAASRNNDIFFISDYTGNPDQEFPPVSERDDSNSWM